MDTLRIKIDQHILTVDLANNSSTRALVDLVTTRGPITIKLHDYGGFEKTGDLGAELPTSDSLIKTGPGDVILYQGRQFVIYYGNNLWSLTRLGKVKDLTASQLKEILGKGDVVATLFI